MPSSKILPSRPRRASLDAANHVKDVERAVAPSEIAVGVIIGRTSEYFDFFVYAIASVLVFPSVFFPFADPLTGALWSFVIFSFAFIGRPIGTLLFMKIQSRYGRAVKLSTALFLLGTSTVGMAFLPSYATLGAGAIVLLSILRFTQGIALGGSWDGLSSLLALSAPKERRGWWAMIPQLGAPIGFMVAAALFLVLHSELPKQEFLDWGWRFPFYVAFAINVVALFARLRLVVTPEYERLLQHNKLVPSPVGKLLKARGSNLFIGAFATLASYALFHLVTVFPLSWISLYSNQSVNDVLTVQIAGGAIAVLGVVVSGLIADRFGRRNTLGSLAIAIALFSFVAPFLMRGSVMGEDIFILLGFALLGLSYGQAAGAVTANFEPEYRYTGAALTSDLAWLIGAAFAPLIALGMSAHFGLGFLGVYLFSGAVCTLVALRVNKVLESRA
ncbi:Inner membrane metabolite transport protein YhjE [Polaromonas vacuolata]|uniref:Inner membrane metabolite transport protein YhjE n=1 Tax=Polaromonas vacuolata TaxID=37448 RepID=A0A6H2H5G2_9BURK|nr:MFS transporter [Polaromonas vacuolata]QJC55043.1 Inner membrane metabolite transport protein YhjE [Polaromonas vacuolata]